MEPGFRKHQSGIPSQASEGIFHEHLAPDDPSQKAVSGASCDGIFAYKGVVYQLGRGVDYLKTDKHELVNHDPSTNQAVDHQVTIVGPLP